MNGEVEFSVVVLEYGNRMSHFNQPQTRTNQTDQMTKHTEHMRNVCVPYNRTTLSSIINNNILYIYIYANKLVDSIQTNDDDHEHRNREIKKKKNVR